MPQPASVLLNRLLAKARFRHLQVLVKLAELGSLQRTAAAIGLTQPAVTHLLADLESLLEAPLFQRHARGVRLTAAGADLLPMARQVLQGLQASAEAVTARRDLGEGVVRVGATAAAINGLLVSALPAFHRRHPAIQVQLREAEINDLLPAVAAGELDLVGCREPAVMPQGWHFTALLDDEFVVVCGPQHPLARRRRVALGDLARHAWLPAPVGSAARTAFDALCERLDQPVATVPVITRTSQVTTAMLQDQPLLALVPATNLRPQLASGQLVALRLHERIPFQSIGMLLPVHHPGEAASCLADFLKNRPHTPARPSRAG